MFIYGLMDVIFDVFLMWIGVKDFNNNNFYLWYDGFVFFFLDWVVGEFSNVIYNCV